MSSAADGQWYISFGGTSPWIGLNESPDGNHSPPSDQPHLYPLESMLIGDFDGDHHADALHYEEFREANRVGYGLKFVMSASGTSPVVVRTEANMR